MKEIKHQLRIELLITPLFVVMAIMSIIYIGFYDIQSTIFTIVCILEVPLMYTGLKIGRKMLYEVMK